jgi:hypothetical protein
MCQIKKHNAMNTVMMDDIKIISKFYTQHFIRHLASYQYVLQELYTEEQETRLIEIQTPLFPMALSASVE